MLALLAGWQSALVHPLEHVDQQGRFVHLAADSTGERTPASDPSQLCDALGALTACAVDAPVRFAESSPEPLQFSAFNSLFARPSAPPFFAQGPPSPRDAALT